MPTCLERGHEVPRAAAALEDARAGREVALDEAEEHVEAGVELSARGREQMLRRVLLQPVLAPVLARVVGLMEQREPACMGDVLRALFRSAKIKRKHCRPRARS